MLPTPRSIGLFLFLFPVPALMAQEARGFVSSGAVAISNVSVIPMTRDTVLAGVTVLLRDGRIAEIGRTVRVPADAERVDGTGRWLIPGLADMHTHLFSDDELPDSLAPAVLGVMLANGITTARREESAYGSEVTINRRMPNAKCEMHNRWSLGISHWAFSG